MAQKMAQAHLQKQLKDLLRHPVGGVKVEPVEGNLMKWDVWLLGPDQTPYEGGCFRAQFTFPDEFPMKPPALKFISDFWHPNVYPDGNVCISILHAPGTDQQNSLETAQMRWTPVQSLEKVLLSVLSMIADPDPSEAGAPANVDALVQWRKGRPQYIEKCRALVQKANTALPKDFVPPQKEDVKPVAEPEFTLHDDDDEDMDIEDDDDDVSEDDSIGDCGGGAKSSNYEAEIAQLEAMGIAGDREHLLQCLRKYSGDIERVVEQLAGEA